MPKQKPVTRDAILKRIKEIDVKFRSTEPWLHSTLAKLARERELLVEERTKNSKLASNTNGDDRSPALTWEHMALLQASIAVVFSRSERHSSPPLIRISVA
jgi:hypothetical protein